MKLGNVMHAAFGLLIGISLNVAVAGDPYGIPGPQGPGASGGGTVTTSGDALSGAGTSGDPLAAAADLENLVDTASVDASGNVTLAAAGNLTADNVILGDPDATGFMLKSTSANVVQILDGDGTDLGTSDVLNFGSSIGSPALRSAPGSATSVAFSFASDPDTGMYRVGADQIGWACGGSLYADLSSTGLNMAVPVRAPAGSVSAVAYQIQGDANTGVYGTADTSIGLAIGGAEQLGFTTTTATFTGDVKVSGGDINGPTSGDFRISAGSGDDFFIASRGSDSMRFSTNQVSVRGGINPGAVSGCPWQIKSDDTTAGTTLTETTATTIMSVTMGGDDNMWSGLVQVNVYAADATEKQLRSTLLLVTIKNDAGTVSGTVTEITSQLEETAGGSTLTDTYTITEAAANTAVLQCDATSSLTQTTLKAVPFAISASMQNMGANISAGPMFP